MNTTGGEAGRPVLVTGGVGYVGSQVVRMLLTRGTHVRVLDRFLYGDGGLAALTPNAQLEIMRGDIRSTSDMRRAVRGVETVIALAALVGDQLCEADPAEGVAVNLKATKVLGKVASEAGVKRVILASSCSVYGSSGQAFVDETATPNPVSLYGETRLLSEELLLKNYPEIGPVVLRLGTVFGLSPRMRFDLVVNAMTARAVTEGKIPVFNGDNWRPFVHVRDAARAFIRAADAPGHVVHGQRFNVGANFLNCTIADLAAVVAHCVQGAVVVPQSPNGDTRSYRVRFDRVREVLWYEPHWSLKEGIGEIVAALSDGTIVDYRDPIYHNALYLVGTPAGGASKAGQARGCGTQA